MTKTKVEFASCAFDSDNLDDWLESDLRQSGILPSKSDKVDKYIKTEELNDWGTRYFCDGSDNKTLGGDTELDKTINGAVFNTTTGATTSTQLGPILKAFLTTLQQHHQHLLQLQKGTMIPPISLFHPTSTLSSPTTVSSSSSTSSASFTPDSINPLQISKTPVNSNMKVSTFKNLNIASTSKKRRREVNCAVDVAGIMDPLTLKRLKNTDAARRSRQRKLVKMEGLQTRVAELEKINEQLQSQVTKGEKERDAGKLKEAQLREKVATLETQLSEAHQSLLANVKQEPLEQPES